MKVELRYLIFASMLLFLPFGAYCQKILVSEINPPDVRWDNFLLKGGEASQESICLMIDSKGFLWTGNSTGLFRFDGIRYVEYGMSDDSTGFAGITVTDIFEDTDGTIWISTSGALNKLDQKTGTFKHFIPDPSGRSDNSNFIIEIKEDRNGILWILTRQHIYSFDRESEKFSQFITDSLSWYPSGGMFFPAEQCYAEDKEGNKWFVAYKSLYLYNNKDKTFKKILPAPDNSETAGIKKINCISSDNDGNLWIGTDNEGLLRWNPVLNKPEKIKIQPDGNSKEHTNSIKAILPDKNGTIWSFGNRSFSNYNPGDNTIRNYLIFCNGRMVDEDSNGAKLNKQVFQTDNGTIWFLFKIEATLFRFDPRTENLIQYWVPNGSLYQAIMDNTGSLWFACILKNINRLVTDKIPYLTIPVDNSSHVTQIHRGAIFEDNSGQVYLLSRNHAFILRNSDGSPQFVPDKFRFPDGDTIAGGGFKDSQGNLWFGNKNGYVAKYNPSTKDVTKLEHFHETAPYYSTDVFFVPVIREDKGGNIWLLGYSGLHRIKGVNDKADKILDLPLRSLDTGMNMYEDFFIDSRDNLWMLYGDSILHMQQPEMKITEFSIPENIRFNSFYENIRVSEDKAGNIFILNCKFGLYRFDRENDKFIKTGITDEDPGSEYYDLLIDRTDRLWISCNKGILVYDQHNNSYRLIKTRKLQYDIQSFQISSGQILILNDNQLYVFNENIPFNDQIPPVYITRVLINDTDYNKINSQCADITSLKLLDLPFNQNYLKFEFAALNYLNAELNRYRYFMTNFDKDTVTVSQGSTAEYKNLPSGRYKFWITGSNNDGIWNPVGTSLDIRIHPPWYRTVLAYLVYLFALLSALAGYIRLRTLRLSKEKIRLQKEIAAATAELETKNRQLEEVDRIKTHFFTDISHEIRTPLSLIMGPLENLSKEEMLSSRLTQIVDLMKRNAQRLMILVNQLLDISKLDAGKMKITLIEDDLVKCLKIFVYEFLSLAESKHIKYIADLPHKTFITWFDRNKIEKIIFNLLSNAFKYTPQNGMVRCIVEIKSKQGNNENPQLMIKVIDSGPGISKENQARIFDRFYRVEGHHEAEGHGTGIGLSLVQEFVLLLKGEIKLKSEPGSGSEFLVILPLGKKHLAENEYVITHPSEEVIPKKPELWRQKYGPRHDTVPAMDKMKVLVIEDNEDLRTFISDTLKDQYNILEAADGQNGINRAFTSIPDLIITDIMMPDLDGVSLCRHLKNDERTSHIPIIMLTARATPEDRVTGLKSGADDYIVKPFNMEEIATRISNLLTLREKLKLKYAKFLLPEGRLELSGTTDEKFMIKVLKIIDTNYRNYNLDVGHLAEQTGMSKTHLTRKLKVLVGLTPGALIHNIRLEKAAEMLKNKAGNITEISNSVGISNPSYFTKAFRIYFGVSPKNYAKR